MEVSEKIQEEVFITTANLLNLEVDLLYFDTTSTYFEVEDEDNPQDTKQYLRQNGLSKDKRPDLASCSSFTENCFFRQL
jgi:transposase, IS4 family